MTVSSSASNKLTGQALLDHLDKPEVRSLDNSEKVRLAGYDPSNIYDQGEFNFQLKKATGWEPKPIKENVDEWRLLQASLCRAASVGWRASLMLETADTEDAQTAIGNLLQDCKSRFQKGLSECVEFQHAALHGNLRNVVFADVYAQANGEQWTEEKYNALQESYFPGVEAAITIPNVGTDIASFEYEAAKAYTNYTRLQNFLFINVLFNLVDDGDRPCVDNPEYINQFKELHNDFEEIGRFDEIYVIRVQLIWCILSMTPLFADEEKSADFINRAAKALSVYDAN